MDGFGDKIHLLSLDKFISMEKENSKLYFENCYFMEQNEKLRKTAEFLEKQNHVLLNELKQRVAATFSSASCITNTTSESSSREADQSSITSASEASTSTRTKAHKSRKKSKK